MFEMEFKFSKLVKITAVRYLRANKGLAAQSTAYASRNWQGKQAIVKEIFKKWKNEKKKSKFVKSLRSMDRFFSRLMTSHYLKAASYM